MFESLTFAAVTATPHSEWTFAEIRDADGATAVVELTCGAETARAASLLAELVSALADRDDVDETTPDAALGLDTTRIAEDRALAAAVSALRSAIVLCRAVRNGVSLRRELGGGEYAASVPLYANVNRGLLGSARRPAEFAAAAERAVREGFDTVKCAPFDEVSPPSSPDRVLELARPGLERVAAVRSAVAPGVTVLVDCHSRFEEHTAPIVAEQLAALEVGWFEEPVEPTRHADALARIARAVPMPVAGGESGYGESFFLDLVGSGAVDVAMPDVKYCGGVAAAHAAGRQVIEAGGRVSLHSPSGPVAQLAGAHVTAAIAGDGEVGTPLEYAAHEANWRPTLLSPPERIERGRLVLPEGPGLGATLDWDEVRRRGRVWSPWQPGRAVSGLTNSSPARRKQ